MQRTIITATDVERTQAPVRGGRITGLDRSPSGPGQQTNKDGYLSKLLKYIPAEVIALYVGLEGIIIPTGSDPADVTSSQKLALWILYVVCGVLTPIYLHYVTKVTKRLQLVISTLSFLAWGFAVGGPFVYTSWYQPVYGSAAVVIVTFALSAVNPEASGTGE